MMNIEVKLTKVAEEEGKQLAYGCIILDNAFVVNGIKLMKAANGNRFVAYPSKKLNTGEYKDTCYPMTKELRDAITTAVISKYEEL